MKDGQATLLDAVNPRARALLRSEDFLNMPCSVHGPVGVGAADVVIE